MPTLGDGTDVGAAVGTTVGTGVAIGVGVTDIVGPLPVRHQQSHDKGFETKIPHGYLPAGQLLVAIGHVFPAGPPGVNVAVQSAAKIFVSRFPNAKITSVTIIKTQKFNKNLIKSL